MTGSEITFRNDLSLQKRNVGTALRPCIAGRASTGVFRTHATAWARASVMRECIAVGAPILGAPKGYVGAQKDYEGRAKALRRRSERVVLVYVPSGGTKNRVRVQVVLMIFSKNKKQLYFF